MWCSWRVPAAMIVFLMLLVSFPSRDGQVVTHSTELIPRSESERAATAIALLPDDQSSAAITHFNSAQRAMRHRQWDVAQFELERALTLAETFRFASATAEMRAQQLAQFQQFHEAYLHLLMVNAFRETAPIKAAQAKALAWEANERAHWWRWRQTMNEMSGRSFEPAISSAEGTANDERVELLKTVQSQLLDDQTVLLEFALSERRSFLWSVSRTAVNAYALPAQSVIQAAVQDAYEQLSQPTNAEHDLAVKRLSQMILGEWAVKDESAQSSRVKVLVVADGALQQVPFSVLLDAQRQKQSVANSSSESEITNIPAALVLLEKKKHEAKKQNALPGGVAVLADPVFNKFDERVVAAKDNDGQWLRPTKAEPELWPQEIQPTTLRSWPAPLTAQVTRLPYARHEAANVTRWFEPALTLQAEGFAASRELAMSGRLANYPIVHFATHGYVNAAHPEQSGLVLSQLNESGSAQAGILQLRDICRMRLPAELVVLSACESGIAQKMPRKSSKDALAASLSEGFLYAGAHRVLGSLWQVNDAATAELMKFFYAGLLGEQHLSPAAALSQAQLKLAQDARWHDPYYWAAFVLQGEW